MKKENARYRPRVASRLTARGHGVQRGSRRHGRGRDERLQVAGWKADSGPSVIVLQREVAVLQQAGRTIR